MLHDLNWSISLSGGILFGENLQGFIESVEPGDVYIITNDGLLFGFGFSYIRFSIDNLGKTVNCMLLGPFILRL